MQKSTIEEIEKRFDNDVERFSNLETGQLTTIDARFNMDLITDCIAKIYSGKVQVLDIGCGAGNYSVMLSRKIKSVDVTLVDLSKPMLDKAHERVLAENKGMVKVWKGDFRSAVFSENTFDVIIATAVFHHLRDDNDWSDSFEKLFYWLKPGGSLWVFDLVSDGNDQIQQFIFNVRYGDYLTSLQNQTYRDKVFDYIEKEDTPRPLVYQLDLLKRVGFKPVSILHKNLCFASYAGFKQIRNFAL